MNNHIKEQRIKEFNELMLKCDVSKGFTQGLTSKEYYRLVDLHSFILSTSKI